MKLKYWHPIRPLSRDAKVCLMSRAKRDSICSEGIMAQLLQSPNV